MEKTKEFQISGPELMSYDPIVILRDVMKSWLLILVSVIVVGVGVYIVSDKSYTPEYKTSTTLVITNRGNSSNVYYNLSSASDLASVFTKLLNSSLMQKRVLEELDMQYFNGEITASAISETNLILLQVTADDPRTAFLVMRTLIENHDIVTYEVVGNVIIEVLQLPKVPTAPSNSSNIKDNVSKAMMITAAVVCVALAILSYLKDTVRSKKEAENKLDCWCLGEIQHEKKYKTFQARMHRKKTGLLITNPAISFRFVENVRKLRRRAEQHMAEGKVLMVTSVMENEGKSTVAVNLALSMAKKYKKVLLIDLDLRKPACYKILETSVKGPGVREVLSGAVDYSEVIWKDPLSGLDVMLEQKVVSDADRYINSDTLGELLETLRAQYKYIVLDLPPMSAAPDSEFVMDHADASLLVVQQNKVNVKALNKAISLLEKGKAKMLGCVLNNIYTTGFTVNQGNRYGYGKYDGYGNYGKMKSEYDNKPMIEKGDM